MARKMQVQRVSHLRTKNESEIIDFEPNNCQEFVAIAITYMNLERYISITISLGNV